MSADKATDRARTSRRNALKAGAAIGVGAAAFAGPQIGILGSTPAYGQAGVCSKPISTLTEDLGSLNNGAGQCGGFARINKAFRDKTVTQNGITATWDDTGCLGTSSITLTSALGYCKISIVTAATSTGIGVSVGPVSVAGTVSVAFPTVTDGQVPNGSTNLVISCSDDIDCVP